MNSVNLIGRLTRDPETRYTTSGMAVCTFSIAIDRQTKEKKTDFPRIVCYDKIAENCERFLAKGRLVGIQGSMRTDSYKNKNGETVSNIYVSANNVEFLEWGKKEKDEITVEYTEVQDEQQEFQPNGFTAIEEDIPF